MDAEAKSTEFALIVACALDGGIGKDNKIPWYIPGDLKHFKQVTTTCPDGFMNAVVMGRNTFESLPPPLRPLPSRVNVVVSTTLEQTSNNNVYIVRSLQDALELIGGLQNVHSTFVIGGSRLYHEALDHPSCTKAFVTHVYHHFPCDVFFPMGPLFSDFTKATKGQVSEHKGLFYAFYTYLRNKN